MIQNLKGDRTFLFFHSDRSLAPEVSSINFVGNCTEMLANLESVVIFALEK